MAKAPTLQIITTAEKLQRFKVATLEEGTTMTDAVNRFMERYIEDHAQRRRDQDAAKVRQIEAAEATEKRRASGKRK